MVKIHFLPKVIKNGLVSEKNYFIFFHNRGGGRGGVRTYYGIFHIFKFFFFNPSLKGAQAVDPHLSESSTSVCTVRKKQKYMIIEWVGLESITHRNHIGTAGV